MLAAEAEGEEQETQIRAAAAAAARSDRPDTFSRLTSNSWLLSEHVQPSQSLLISQVRAGGEAWWETPGTPPSEEGSLSPHQAVLYIWSCQKTLQMFN